MKRYLLLLGGLATLFLLLFGIGTVLLPVEWHNPTSWLTVGRSSGGMVGIALLIADVVLPVPSTLVMTLLGAFYGIVIGTATSIVGNVGAAAFGFWIGRKGGSSLNRFLSAQDRDAATTFLEKWGEVGVILSRPIPILAESVAILAGTSSALSWAKLLRAALIGSLPASLLYAWVGARALSLASEAMVFGGVLLLAGLSLMINWRAVQTASSDTR